MMDPPMKLFGQTIAFTTSASSQDEGHEGAITTSTGGWGDLATSSQEVTENVVESENGDLRPRANCPAGSLPDLSPSVSNCGDEERLCRSPHRPGVEEKAAASAGEGAGDDDDSEEDEGARSKSEGGEDCKEDKTPRRPDKAVACPRCHSLETKFCYYNNYNVNQPRHFCKHCQRYWTAGGTLRNVPVGAGRRKNKHGSTIAPRRQTPEVGAVRSDAADVATPLIVPKGVAGPMPMQVSVVQTAVGASCAAKQPGVMRMAVTTSSDPSGVLPFMRMPSSVETACILTDSGTSSEAGKRVRDLATTGFGDGSTVANIEMRDVSAGTSGAVWQTTRDESPCSTHPGGAGLHDIKGEPGACPDFTQVAGAAPGEWASGGPPCPSGPGPSTGSYGFFNGGWPPYAYNVGWNGPPFCAGGVPPAGAAIPPPPPGGVTAWNGSAASVWAGVHWPMPGLAWGPAGWCPPWAMASWAMSAGPGSTMGMTPAIASGVGNTSPSLRAPLSSRTSAGPGVVASAPVSPQLLGKHSRAAEVGRADGAVWTPKSLRMADPEEAILSSVWRILGNGTRPEQGTSTASSFKAFQVRNESKRTADDDQQAVQASLHANPAAMSRSMNFHESN